jgi:uncharacterized protein (DUF433 family)
MDWDSWDSLVPSVTRAFPFETRFGLVAAFMGDAAAIPRLRPLNPASSFDVLDGMKNWQDYIVSDEGVLLGKPTLKGTRLSVDFILGRLADGWTEEQLFESYPRLTRDHLRAAFSYLHECLEDGLLFSQMEVRHS